MNRMGKAALMGGFFCCHNQGEHRIIQLSYKRWLWYGKSKNRNRGQFTLEKGWNKCPADQEIIKPDTAVPNATQKEDDSNQR